MAQSNLLIQYADCANTLIQESSDASTQQLHFRLCTQLLQQLNSFFTEKDCCLPLDQEHREIFLNNFCSPVQVLLVNMGSDLITNTLLEQIVHFVVFIFKEEKRVLNGGLFIINGLVSAVEGRIAPFWKDLENYILHACTKQDTDDLGVRMALGLISDFANNMQASIAPSLPQIVPVLQNVFNDSSYEPDAKLRAIVALGDLNLACENKFMSYFESVFNSFLQASQFSLKKPDHEEEAQVLIQLKEALLEGYVSILYGVNSDRDFKGNCDADVERYCRQIFEYLETVVINGEDSFPPTLILEIFNLFMDISRMFLGGLEKDIEQVRDGSASMESKLSLYILKSKLPEILRNGLPSLNED